MRFGIRKPSVRGMLSSRTSVKRAVRHRAGLKMGRGLGFLSDPDKYVYNTVYRKTSVSFSSFFGSLFK